MLNEVSFLLSFPPARFFLVELGSVRLKSCYVQEGNVEENLSMMDTEYNSLWEKEVLAV